MKLCSRTWKGWEHSGEGESIGALWVWGRDSEYHDAINPSVSWWHQLLTCVLHVLTYSYKSDLGLMSQGNPSGATRWFPFPLSLLPIKSLLKLHPCLKTRGGMYFDWLLFLFFLKHFKHKNARKYETYFILSIKLKVSPIPLNRGIQYLVYSRVPFIK